MSQAHALRPGRGAAACAVPPAPTFLAQGFTLIELAMAMFIIALLLGGMLMPLSAQQEAKSRMESERLLTEAKETLSGHAVAKGYLPCPDTDGDGAENLVDALAAPGARSCTALEGDLPYQALGIAPADGFNYRLRYRVSASFAKTIALTDEGDITVISRGDNVATTPALEAKKENTLTTKAPAVLISPGKNGRGGLLREGGQRLPAPPSGTDELLNFTGAKKVVRTPAPATSGCEDNETETTPLCEFDDQVLWLSANALFNRLISAGKL